MTAIAMPRPRRRKSKPAQLAKNAARAWTAIKIIKVMPGKHAKKGAAAVATYKVVSFVKKGGKKLIVIPIAAGGGLAAYKKLHSSSSDEAPATPYGSPVGPVATPATVTPPKTAPGANTTLNGEVPDAGMPATGPESTSAS
jgi:hypothetical protein